MSDMSDDVAGLLGFMRIVGFELLGWSSDSELKGGSLNSGVSFL